MEQIKRSKKSASGTSTPLPLNLEGFLGFLYLSFVVKLSMNVLQQIFSDFYDQILTLPLRPVVVENIDKMIHCGDFSKGFALYGCTHCGKFKPVAFRCKSRFCPTCGNLYSRKRSTAMSFKLLNCRHRHCVFTIPEQLRLFFLKDRSLLSDLFHSVRDVILRLFSKMNRSENFTPGFICVLHTFGRDLKWNPHIHVLVSEGAAGNMTPWRKVSHFNFNFLRFAFRTALLDRLAARLGSSFTTMKSLIYKLCPQGFYVYAKPSVCNPHQVAKYIGRYLGRPVIATSRIDSYDGQSVTFHYNRHEDGLLIHETISVMDFIKRLIRHIPDKHFKMIRYYGLYAKHHPQMPYFRYAIHPSKRKILRSFNRWRDSIALSFGLDPLLCSCGHTMSILEIYHHHTALFHQYLKDPDSS